MANTEPSEHARRAAEKILNAYPPPAAASYYPQVHSVSVSIIQSAIDAAETVFIDRLVTALESHGIDATNWDGDDPPHIIIANGIATGLKLKIEAATAELKADKAGRIGTLAGLAEGLLCRVEHDFTCATRKRKRTGPECDCSLAAIKAKIISALHPEQKEKE